MPPPSSEAQAARPSKPKGKAFTLKGIGLTALPVTDGALTGALTLDPTSANKHARTLLDLSRRTSAAPRPRPSARPATRSSSSTSASPRPTRSQATDVVKVIGKVVERQLDIRKITVKRADDRRVARAQS